MTIEPKAMDPQRLDALREHITSGTVVVSYFDARALFADRDHRAKGLRETFAHLVEGRALLLESERQLAIERVKTAKFRARCTVEDNDVETAGLTWEQVDAWVIAQPDGDGEIASDGRPLDSWRMKRENPDGPTWGYGFGVTIHRGQSLAAVVANAAKVTGSAPFDILEAMAAIEVPS